MGIKILGDVHLRAGMKIHGRELFNASGVNMHLAKTEAALAHVAASLSPTDLLISAGDLFDVHNPSMRNIEAAARFVDKCPCKVVLLGGNHELPTSGTSPLDIVAMTNRDKCVAVKDIQRMYVPIGEGRGYNIVLVPYQRQPGPNVQDITDLMSEGSHNIIVFHGTVENSGFVKHDEWPVPVDLLKKFNAAVGGHLHMEKQFYCGGFAPHSHSEDGLHPSYVSLMDIGGKLKMSRVNVPRDMFLKFATCELSGNGIEDDITRALSKCAGADIVRLVFPHGHSQDAARTVAAAIERAGAASVDIWYLKKDAKDRLMIGADVEVEKLSVEQLVKQAAESQGDAFPEWAGQLLAVIEAAL